MAASSSVFLMAPFVIEGGYRYGIDSGTDQEIVLFCVVEVIVHVYVLVEKLGFVI